MQKSGLDHFYTRQSPDDMRFTKPTIDLNFPGQHEFENIYDVLSALEQKILQPRSLPSLRVFRHDNQLWTIDNKLLYIYRISPKVRRVSIAFISGIKFIDRLVNDNSKSDLERMASPDFFPEVVRTDAVVVAHPSPSSSQDCVLLPTVAGFKKIEKERIIAAKSHSSTSPKSLSSRSNSSSKTVTSCTSSEENVESNLMAGTETNSSYRKPLRTCTVRNRISVDSLTNSSVKSYPIKAINNNRGGSHMKERIPSLDSSTGQIYSQDFAETTTFSEGARQSTPESKFRDQLWSTTMEKDEPPLNSSPRFTRAVVECRDIPVCNTLPAVHTLMEQTNFNHSWDTVAATEHSAESKSDETPLQFKLEAPDSPVISDSNSTEELSKWREIDTADATPNLLGYFPAKSNLMNQVRSDNKNVIETEEHGQHQHVPLSSRRHSPLKRHTETVSHTSSDSSKDWQSRLDRPLSSCGSSAPPILERPSTCNFPLDGRKNGPLFRLCSTSIIQPDRPNQSPPKARTRAFLLAEKKTHSKLSEQHELEVSKKILLKHMKKAFFSVY